MAILRCEEHGAGDLQFGGVPTPHLGVALEAAVVVRVTLALNHRTKALVIGRMSLWSRDFRKSRRDCPAPLSLLFGRLRPARRVASELIPKKELIKGESKKVIKFGNWSERFFVPTQLSIQQCKVTLRVILPKFSSKIYPRSNYFRLFAWSCHVIKNQVSSLQKIRSGIFGA